MNVVLLFPGQSSRYPGMITKLSGLCPGSRELLGQSSEILGRDLAAHYREDNPEVFARNLDVQVGVFLANHLLLKIIDETGVSAAGSAGLSLGEYNHLVHIGALTFAEALALVEQRGRAYDEGPRGAMASVFPIDLEELEEIARRASRCGVLEVVNFNSPRQQVLSGETAALEEALRIIEEETLAQTVVIERQVPMHCSIFRPVADRLRPHLEAAAFKLPGLPYLPNRLGRFLDDPRPADFIELLATHVCSPVLWRQSIDAAVERWPDVVLVEVGPKAVLHNLLDRKWHRNRKLHCDSAKDTATHLGQVMAALQPPGACGASAREQLS